MSVRREGREAAVQYLYSLDRNRAPEPSDLELFWSIHQAGPAVREFASGLIAGVLERMTDIDGRLSLAVQNWDLGRLEVVDRCILRVAVYEMFDCLETPPVVAINEAIEIAKRLGTPDSARFVNGVLDRLRRDLERPLRTASPGVSAGGEEGSSM